MNFTNAHAHQQAERCAVLSYCENCEGTEGVTDFWPEDSDKPILLCQECADVEAAIALAHREHVVDFDSQSCRLCRAEVKAAKIEPMQGRLFPMREVA